MNHIPKVKKINSIYIRLIYYYYTWLQKNMESSDESNTASTSIIFPFYFPSFPYILFII